MPCFLVFRDFCHLHISIKIIDPNRNVKRGEMKQEIYELNEKKKNRNKRKLLSVANKMWHSCLYCPLSREFKFENMINIF
jgi:hypothetical protein